jgi:hypothetical protein
MQHFDFANVNRMDVCGQILSHSETFASRAGGKSKEKSWNSRQPVEKQAIISRPECPEMGIIRTILPAVKVHDIWCKRGAKVGKNLHIIGTGN